MPQLKALKAGQRATNLLIVAGTILFVLAVWVFVVVQTRYERQEAIAAAIAQNVNRAVAFQQYVARTIEAADVATAFLADRYGELLDTGAREDRTVVAIDGVWLRPDSFAEINLIDAEGNLVASSVSPTPVSVNVASAPAFQSHLRDRRTNLRVHPPSRSRFADKWLVILSRRINRPDGSLAGVVGIQIHPSELTEFVRDGLVGETDVLSVIGLDGITRARRTGNVESFGEDLRGRLVMEMQARNPNGTYRGPSALDGITRYFSHRRLPQYGLFVTSGVAEDVVLRPSRHRAWAYIAAAALISIITIATAHLLRTMIKRQAHRAAEVMTVNARLEEAQRLARLGDWSFDPNRRELVWSPGLAEMYERPRSSVILSLDELPSVMGQGGAAAFAQLLDRIAATGEGAEVELVTKLGSGTVSHRRIVAAPSFDEAGQVIGIHGTDQDVTPGKLLESLQEQVTHLSRLDAVNAIASTLAHELNQPLTAASNFLSGSIRLVERRDAEDDALILEALRSVQSQIGYSGNIIRRVRELVGNRHAHTAPVMLSQVVADAVALIEAAKPGFQGLVQWAPDPDCSSVLGDHTQLQQVLVNLMRNAREANRDADAQVVVSAVCTDADWVVVSVRDHGHGIPAQMDIFSPFASTKREGLGLGLAISRTLVEAMGGQIWVQETGSSGTVISLKLRNAQRG